MERELILLDTPILIDYFRKKNKRNSDFIDSWPQIDILMLFLSLLNMKYT